MVDQFITALQESLGLLVRESPGGWIERRGDVLGIVTGLAIPTVNGVVCASPGASSVDVSALLDKVRAAGVPYSLHLRPGSAAGLLELAQLLGMSRIGDFPAMVLEGQPAPLGRAESVAVRRLRGDERGVHFSLACEAFEAPTDVFAPVAGAFSLPDVRLYAVDVDGQTVTTCAAIDVSDAVTVFNVATRDRYRRRGYGSAVTARAVLEGNASRAFLQSSPMGVGVYTRLGFRVIETWQLWVAERPESVL